MIDITTMNLNTAGYSLNDFSYALIALIIGGYTRVKKVTPQLEKFLYSAASLGSQKSFHTAKVWSGVLRFASGSVRFAFSKLSTFARLFAY